MSSETDRAIPRVPIFDRETGRLVDEVVFKGEFLLDAYGTTRGRLLTWLWWSRPVYSHLYGLMQRGPWSRATIPTFVARYGVRVDELERPLESYRDFNEFFVRRLRPGARPLDPDPAALIAPADGRLLAYRLREGTAVPVKGRAFRVAALVGDPGLAARYHDGTCLVVRLAPADYHRFCYVDDGHHGPIVALGDRLHSVHPFCLRSGAPVFAVNYRERSLLHTARFGDVVHLDVGAMRVGRIVQHRRCGGRVARGEEKGWFEFGASTVILLLAPGVVTIDADLWDHSAAGVETLVRLGSRIGTRAP